MVVLSLAFSCQDLTNRQTTPFNHLVHEIPPRGRMRNGYREGHNVDARSPEPIEPTASLHRGPHLGHLRLEKLEGLHFIAISSKFSGFGSKQRIMGKQLFLLATIIIVTICKKIFLCCFSLKL